MDLIPHGDNRPESLATASSRDLEAIIADWLALDVANGDACRDTLTTYRYHIESWLSWCDENGVHPGWATTEDVKGWRQDLITEGVKPATIALKLTTIRRFYQSAVDRGLLKANPAANVRAPKDRQAKEERMKYLTAGEAELLFRAVDNDGTLKSLRDRAMIGLMALEGLRRSEVMNLSCSDMEQTIDGSLRLLVHGKGKNRYCYPREDTAAALHSYVLALGRMDQDGQGSPIFVRIRKGDHPGGRITRQGLNQVIDSYLLKAGLKRKGLSCHALRHTCGSLLYQATRDIRAVQETLGHSNINTSAGYASITERSKARHTRQIPVKLLTPDEGEN